MSKLLDFAKPISSEMQSERGLFIEKKKHLRKEKTTKPHCIAEISKTNSSFLFKPTKEKTSYYPYDSQKMTIKTKDIPKVMKRIEYDDQENNKNFLNRKRGRSDDNYLPCCMICNWEYPLEMNGTERQLHVNRCIDGNGQNDKKDYLMSKSTAIISSDITDSQSEYLYCPICSHPLNTIENNHLQTCALKFIYFNKPNLAFSEKFE